MIGLIIFKSYFRKFIFKRIKIFLKWDGAINVYIPLPEKIEVGPVDDVDGRDHEGKVRRKVCSLQFKDCQLPTAGCQLN